MGLVEDNSIPNLRKPFNYLNVTTYLNLKNNLVSSLANSFITALNQSEKLAWLNKLTSLLQNIQMLRNMEQIWLSDNPFYCDCEMTWMTGWLNNFTTSSGRHVIVDYQELKCHSGMMLGQPIYILDKVNMGCFLSKLTKEEKIFIGLGSELTIVINISLIIGMALRSREFKFLIHYYLKLDTVPKDDKDENVDNKEYDAFFCYRYKHF